MKSRLFNEINRLVESADRLAARAEEEAKKFGSEARQAKDALRDDLKPKLQGTLRSAADQLDRLRDRLGKAADSLGGKTESTPETKPADVTSASKSAAPPPPRKEAKPRSRK